MHPRSSRESLDAYFGAARVVRDVSFGVAAGQVTAIIGPSGCGKSTLLRCINRMHETVPAARVEGECGSRGETFIGRGVSAAISVRRHIGMVFQRPTPFPTMSIRENVAAGLAVLPREERPSRRETDDIVERALRRAALWEEVKDRLVGERGRAVGRPAAAPLHRARSRDVADGDPARRADGVARSDQHAARRRARLRAALRRDDHHRDAQHATGGAHLGRNGVHAERRARRVSPRPTRCSPRRAIRVPRHT